MPERTAFQSHISSMAAEALGIRPSALSARTEHMCASGTVGIRYAYAFIAAGLADLVMVLGVEKLNQPTGDEAILNMGTGVDREWEAALRPHRRRRASRWPPSATWPSTARPRSSWRASGVKNHTHASKNPNAHFNKGATLDQVLCSRMISSPLRLFMCSPITDGAAAVMLGVRGAGARPHRQARVDPRHRPGARRLPAHVAARGLRALAGARARGRSPRTRWRA